MNELPKYDLDVELDPEERLELSHDFSTLMDEAGGEEIVGPVITITKLSDSSDVTSLMLIGASTRIKDQYGQIAYGVTGAGGSDGEDYAVKILATTDRDVGATSPRLKANHLLRVRSR